MAGNGPPPKPDAQRRRKNAPTFDWTVLPVAGREGPAPELPEWREWSDATREWWADLWTTPQSTVWDQTGRTLWTLAVLHHELIEDAFAEGPVRSGSIAAEMRQHEDRHGISPKALLALRWRIDTDDVPATAVQDDPEKKRTSRTQRARSAKAQTAGLANRLKAV